MFAVLTAFVQAAALTVAPLPAPRLPIATGIVGRASCRGRVHLLTKRGELIEITTPRRPVFEVHASPELAAKPELWGLACLSDGSLWTLETGHSLASLSRDGRVLSRTALQLPWMAVFGVGDRLVYQALPIVIDAPVLAAAPPAALDRPHAWPGLAGRSGAGSLPSAARNLLRCGIAAGGRQPCWFIDRASVSVASSDSARSIDVPPHDLASFDREMPLWDAAVADGARIWLLATSAAAGDRARRADTVILLAEGRPTARIRLPRPARLFLFASDSRCTLLLEGGEFVEVIAS